MMDNREYILRHRGEDVRVLALRGAEAGVDVPYCLCQIEAWQKARVKLPRWAATDGILFPPRLNMEQCSSQWAAEYKARQVERLLPRGRASMADLTGGLGVDFSFLAPLFRSATYVERDPGLCEAALHNLPLLGAAHARVECAAAEDFLKATGCHDLIYLDPSRRDGTGRKVVALHDCSPDVQALAGTLRARARLVMVKLSPMLDISHALAALPDVREVHVVSVEGECRELLLALAPGEASPVYRCANLGRTPQYFSTSGRHARPRVAPRPARFLYEPNASILKAGVQDALCARCGVEKLHPFSHLFTSEVLCGDFPGRRFRIEGVSACGKRELKTFLRDVRQANLAVRNFPSTVAALRKQWRLAEGGDIYLFATTLADGSHALVRCSRV